jgi:hypothetical protein
MRTMGVGVPEMNAEHAAQGAALLPTKTKATSGGAIVSTPDVGRETREYTEDDFASASHSEVTQRA